MCHVPLYVLSLAAIPTCTLYCERILKVLGRATNLLNGTVDFLDRSNSCSFREEYTLNKKPAGVEETEISEKCFAKYLKTIGQDIRKLLIFESLDQNMGEICHQ